ncbi:SUN domain-containing protein 5 isoform X2 [Monodelphis domestica]|uniref:SUN domain-containing protein 5 isoform X2 n=1 Tax=Monodelphis domestica TaxID=13616 RepID=UPI0024E27496|nr:SUN domain-containing protein 5 isoform X2 [Monodelphis domestica]
MRRSQRVHSIDCSNSAENESDLNPTSLTRSRRQNIKVFNKKKKKEEEEEELEDLEEEEEEEEEAYDLNFHERYGKPMQKLGDGIRLQTRGKHQLGPSHQITPSVSENFNLEENHSDSYLINRTSERSATQDVAPQLVTTVIFPSCRSLLSWLSTKILIHKLVEKLAILFICVFVFWCIIMCLPTKLNTGRTSVRPSGEVKKSTSSLKDLRLYQEKVRKHTEEIEALQSLMEELSAKVQEVKVMSNEDLVAQNIMKKIQGDYIEKPDFALKSIGGTIDFDRTSATYSYDKARSYWSWFRLWNYAHSPEVILEPNMTPGNCWAFSGDRGQVVIRLARKIFLTNVTIQHIPKTISLSGSLDTAPKDFVVYGINDKIKEETFLGAFLFQPENSIQMFPLQNSLCKSFNYIKLKILTNWGNPHFTCLYRVRAHGTISRPAHDHYPQG